MTIIVKPADGPSWRGWMTFTLIPWATFLLPLLVCLLATLLLNLEHQNHQWKHLNALPVSRWKHYATKPFILGWLLLMAHLLLLAGFFVGGWVIKWARPTLHLENPSLVFTSKLLGLLFLTSWAMLSTHTWLASRFSNLGVNLAVGIGGFVLSGVASQRPAMARFLPWAMPSLGITDWMGPNTPTPWLVVGISLTIGSVLFALACWDAQHRESAG